MAGTYQPGDPHPPMASNDSPKFDERVDYSNLPCPPPYEELHREVFSSLKPELFEGMRFDLIKMLNPKFALIHSASMGAEEVRNQSRETLKIPTAQYQFGVNFIDPKLLLIGRAMTDGKVNASGKFDLTENVSLKGTGQFTSEPGMSHVGGSVDYKGRDYRAQFQMGSAGVFGANYIQSVTPNLSLGGEAFWIGEQHRSFVGFGARYCTDKTVATVQVSSAGSVMLGYVQKICERVKTTELTYNYVTRESLASVGYDYLYRQSRVRGNIDSNARVSAFLEERLGGGLNFILSGEIDRQKKDHKFGIGLTFGY